MKKSKFLKSAAMAVAGIALTTTISSCSMMDAKHSCMFKGDTSEKEKSQCSKKEEDKHSCSKKEEDKHSCSKKEESKHSCSKSSCGKKK